MENLKGLLDYGQSYWLDNLTRKKITSGELKKRVEEQGLRGITSNPSIFDKAISDSADYDQQIQELVKANASAEQIYEALTVKDVQDACDILRPVYDQSKGKDGFVSLEVSPYLARDTQGSIEEARRLFKAINRPNSFIKLPGTKEGVPAIEELLYEGININITLLFSIENYVAVADAYIKAMERRVADGKKADTISVASFFLSRVDKLVDKMLDGYKPDTDNKFPIVTIKGKVGLASARLAYQRFKQIFGQEKWKEMEGKGAYVQRVLWASTSNKDPLYSDLRYVEALIGKDTINTLPDATIDALAAHGALRKNTIEEGLEEAQFVFDHLKNYNIDIAKVTEQLEEEGIQLFKDAYDKLIANLKEKKAKIQGAVAH
jgi:transaldolase